MLEFAGSRKVLSCALQGLSDWAGFPGFCLAVPPWAEFLRRFAAIKLAVGVSFGYGCGPPKGGLLFECAF
jgi:hypothetical protein